MASKAKASSGGKNKANAKHKQRDGKKKTGQVKEIVFDPDARRKHLQGFSARKRERRAFGLAMQKVKDRQSKLENRQSEREARREQVQMAEQQKDEIMQTILAERGVKVQGTSNEAREDKQEHLEKIETYQDTQTQSMWGGDVVVIVSTKIPGAEEEIVTATAPKQVRKHKKADEEQEFAGKVERYLPQVKATLQGKKKKQQTRKTKGMHGAATMKGMASHSGDFKLAQKALQRASGKAGGKDASRRKRR
jgi:ribosomal RNA-processing protein 17